MDFPTPDAPENAALNYRGDRGLRRVRRDRLGNSLKFHPTVGGLAKKRSLGLAEILAVFIVPAHEKRDAALAGDFINLHPAAETVDASRAHIDALRGVLVVSGIVAVFVDEPARSVRAFAAHRAVMRRQIPVLRLSLFVEALKITVYDQRFAREHPRRHCGHRTYKRLIHCFPLKFN